MPFFRKKPVVIEAHQFGGSSTERAALRAWIAGGKYVKPHLTTRDHCRISITTLEGVMEAEPGDWIIKGVKGEFYPCKPDIFKMTYDLEDFVRLYDPFNTQSLSLSAAHIALDKIGRYFVSGNDVPVERAIIKTSDFTRILSDAEQHVSKAPT